MLFYNYFYIINRFCQALRICSRTCQFKKPDSQSDSPPCFQCSHHFFLRYIDFQLILESSFFFATQGGSPMAISYKKLWKLLIDKDLKKKDLQRISGVSAASITKLAKNENVNTEIIEKVCLALHCDVGDIMEITKN